MDWLPSFQTLPFRAVGPLGQQLWQAARMGTLEGWLLLPGGPVMGPAGHSTPTCPPAPSSAEELCRPDITQSLPIPGRTPQTAGNTTGKGGGQLLGQTWPPRLPRGPDVVSPPLRLAPSAAR